jgi:hypothetical protein
MLRMNTRRLVLVVVAVAAPTVFVPRGARGATLCVNVEGTGGCFASVQAAVDVAAGGDTISIAAGTYSEAVDVRGLRPLRLEGQGAESTIIDGGSNVALIVRGQARVTAGGLTLQSVDGGATIGVQQATLQLDDCVVVGPPTPNGNCVVLQRARARIRRCLLTGAGGTAIVVGNSSSARVEDSLLTGNFGGLVTYSRALIVNTTISGNRKGVSGFMGERRSRLRIRSSTIADNPNPGLGGINVAIDAFEAKVLVLSSIVEGECSLTVPSDLVSQGHNLLSECTPTAGRTDLDLLNTDPLLGPLQDNGGPTETMLPQPGSPAIDAIDSARLCAPPDQRGVERGRPCDVGAVDTP